MKNPQKPFLNFEDAKHPPYIGNDGYIYIWSTQEKKYISIQKEDYLEILETLPKKADLVDGLVPVDQLPSFVTDVWEVLMLGEAPEGFTDQMIIDSLLSIPKEQLEELKVERVYLDKDEFWVNGQNLGKKIISLGNNESTDDWTFEEPRSSSIYVDPITKESYRWSGTMMYNFHENLKEGIEELDTKVKELEKAGWELYEWIPVEEQSMPGKIPCILEMRASLSFEFEAKLFYSLGVDYDFEYDFTLTQSFLRGKGNPKFIFHEVFEKSMGRTNLYLYSFKTGGNVKYKLLINRLNKGTNGIVVKPITSVSRWFDKDEFDMSNMVFPVSYGSNEKSGEIEAISFSTYKREDNDLNSLGKNYSSMSIDSKGIKFTDSKGKNNFLVARESKSLDHDLYFTKSEEEDKITDPEQYSTVHGNFEGHFKGNFDILSGESSLILVPTIRVTGNNPSDAVRDFSNYIVANYLGKENTYFFGSYKTSELGKVNRIEAFIQEVSAYYIPVININKPKLVGARFFVYERDDAGGTKIYHYGYGGPDSQTLYSGGLEFVNTKVNGSNISLELVSSTKVSGLGNSRFIPVQTVEVDADSSTGDEVFFTNVAETFVNFVSENYHETTFTVKNNALFEGTFSIKGVPDSVYRIELFTRNIGEYDSSSVGYRPKEASGMIYYEDKIVPFSIKDYSLKIGTEFVGSSVDKGLGWKSYRWSVPTYTGLCRVATIRYNNQRNTENFSLFKAILMRDHYENLTSGTGWIEFNPISVLRINYASHRELLVKKKDIVDQNYNYLYTEVVVDSRHSSDKASPQKFFLSINTFGDDSVEVSINEEVVEVQENDGYREISPVYESSSDFCIPIDYNRGLKFGMGYDSGYRVAPYTTTDTDHGDLSGLRFEGRDEIGSSFPAVLFGKAFLGDLYGTADDSNKLNGKKSGFHNGDVAVYAPFPTASEIVELGYNIQENVNNTELYLKGLCKWCVGYRNEGSVNLIGRATPNSRGLCFINFYGDSGVGSDGKGGTENGAEADLPRYLSGVYFSAESIIIQFRCWEGKWYYGDGSFSGSASRLGGKPLGYFAAAENTMNLERKLVDPNEITKISVTEVNSSTNAPTKTSWHIYMTWGSTDSSYGFQLATSYVDRDAGLYYRHKVGGTWTGWKQLADFTDIIWENLSKKPLPYFELGKNIDITGDSLENIINFGLERGGKYYYPIIANQDLTDTLYAAIGETLDMLSGAYYGQVAVSKDTSIVHDSWNHWEVEGFFYGRDGYVQFMYSFDDTTKQYNFEIVGTVKTNADTVDGKHVAVMTTAEYNDLTTKDTNTIYMVTD